MLNREKKQQKSPDNRASVIIVYQQSPFSCPFVRAVVWDEKRANALINHLRRESSYQKLWIEKFDVLE